MRSMGRSRFSDHKKYGRCVYPSPAPIPGEVAPTLEQGPSFSMADSAAVGQRVRLLSKIDTAVSSFFMVRNVASSMTRDFCARERTFMSWVKTSAVMAGLSGLLLLRFNLDDVQSSPKASVLLVDPRGPQGSRLSVQRALRRRWRERIYAMKIAPAQSEYGFAEKATGYILDTIPPPSELLTFQTTNSLLEPSAFQMPKVALKQQVSRGVLDTATGSLVLGLIYFVVALLALGIGTFDYLQRERALERIDVLAQAGSAHPMCDGQADGAVMAHSGPREIASAIGRKIELHLADKDVEHARSGKIVNFMTGLLSLVIAISAVLLLVDEELRTA
ncbi:hypothetical protein K437DRAFT_69639 [Tilletiaria anomala UBC 951]|uniref:DUF202 domain-containing protein n=1 Tax=Tilletiaria anomala (strain ATCC 24038 / CBS 436.72 / UBC 951) TaxID=1037660 RepID=A0A066WLD4_TILAU|nr:uncharacterized protein K437DRAFT_69639 [Tilletiaria anomala UBC 951]KDN53378.1 hypothetical protein K437DRAFT_69639 [Tilletiaria anomala UBC 951]